MHFSAAPATPTNHTRNAIQQRDKQSQCATDQQVWSTESKSGKIISHFLWSFLKVLIIML